MRRGLGLAVTLTLLSSAALTVAVRRPAQRWGPRTALLGLAGLIVLSAILFLATRSPWLVVAAAMLGNLAVGTGESGPFPGPGAGGGHARKHPRRAHARAQPLQPHPGYVASALGAVLVTRLTGSPAWLFALFLAGGLIQLMAYGLMRPTPPVTAGGAGAPDDPIALARPPHRRPLRAGLLRRRFRHPEPGHLLVLHSLRAGPLSTLGWIFFGTQVLSGLSLAARRTAGAAAGAGQYHGLLPPHLQRPALIALALAPTLSVAVILLLARHLLSQMDLPTRQTFLMLAVEDQGGSTPPL